MYDNMYHVRYIRTFYSSRGIHIMYIYIYLLTHVSVHEKKAIFVLRTCTFTTRYY